jgi:hypothetical protein
MSLIHQSTLAFAIPYAMAAVGFSLLGLRGRRGLLVFLAACLPLAAAPCLIPSNRHLLRFLAALSAGYVGTKLYDVRYDSLRGDRPSFEEFLVFLVNPFTQVRRRLSLEPRAERKSDVLRLGTAVCVLGIAIPIWRFVFGRDWAGVPFLAEHAVKLFTLYLPLLAALSFGASLWRLLGGSARDHMNNPFLAQTPADFWRRYNRNMQQFFMEDIFMPLGGRHAPYRTLLLVFVLSGLLHEWIFGISTGRVQGYQMAFFSIQGISVAATARVRPRGWRAVAWTVGTFLFVVLSSILFFASMQGVAPFYSRAPLF